MIFNNVKKNWNKKLITTKNESWNRICSMFCDVGFSQQITYIKFKRLYASSFALSRNTKHINLKLKLTRSLFKVFNNSANLNGFYRAKW
jgi:hypothetical protein